MKAIRIYEHGGPEVLRFEEMPRPIPRATEDLLRRGSDVLSWIAEGTLRARLASTFPLAEAARAHRLLESREVVGKLVLLPMREEIALDKQYRI